MSPARALATIPVSVIVERSKAMSQWADYIWRPAEVLTGQPDTPPWTRISGNDERARFYAGAAHIELHQTETGNYRDNLGIETPLLWVVLRPVDADPSYELAMVTADPAEGEAMTEAGNNLVDTVPMPKSVQETIAQFVAEHHVEQTFMKRKRDRANPEALGRRTPASRENR